CRRPGLEIVSLPVIREQGCDFTPQIGVVTGFPHIQLTFRRITLQSFAKNLFNLLPAFHLRPSPCHPVPGAAKHEQNSSPESPCPVPPLKLRRSPPRSSRRRNAFPGLDTSARRSSKGAREPDRRRQSVQFAD